MARKPAAPSDTLTIACKLPQGLDIQLPQHRIFLKLHGPHSPFAVAGHGMTRGVKAGDWAIIQDVFKDAAWLKNEFVFAMPDPESAADKAEDREKVNAGFDPIDPFAPATARGAGMIQPEGEPDPAAR